MKKFIGMKYIGFANSGKLLEKNIIYLSQMPVRNKVYKITPKLFRIVEMILYILNNFILNYQMFRFPHTRE